MAFNSLSNKFWLRGRGGGVLGFQVTGMIEWGEKKNPEKSQNRKFIDSNNPMPNF